MQNSNKQNELEKELGQLKIKERELTEVLEHAQLIYEDLSRRAMAWTTLKLIHSRTANTSDEQFRKEHPETVTAQMLRDIREEINTLKGKLSTNKREQMRIHVDIQNIKKHALEKAEPASDEIMLNIPRAAPAA